jgi:hypothetical protein
MERNVYERSVIERRDRHAEPNSLADTRLESISSDLIMVAVIGHCMFMYFILDKVI